ncbi:hypothetical protein EYC80_002461 [Monilinia laxa]|uniref:Uncharacterized protein n=1 Tax=Monilinia laxa TaxID=61186 RepID=A0A5N6K3V9_MONLA|nr:hypothetical protein EYC80_002461 [Monilinia laxa]
MSFSNSLKEASKVAKTRNDLDVVTQRDAVISIGRRKFIKIHFLNRCINTKFSIAPFTYSVVELAGSFTSDSTSYTYICIVTATRHFFFEENSLINHNFDTFMAGSY